MRIKRMIALAIITAIFITTFNYLSKTIAIVKPKIETRGDNVANIDDKVAQIRQAIYGKDVRESIASGIETINDETESTTARQTSLETTFNQLIINAGNSNAEIVAARVDKDGTAYPTLGDRLNNIDSQLAEKVTQFDRIKNYYYKQYPQTLTKYVFPSAFGWQSVPINIYTDGTNLFTDFDVSKFKNTGGKNIYVDPINGLSTNDGLTESTPAQSLLKAYTLANDGDTIICLDGNYKRSALFQGQKIEKNLNIIAKNKGKARFFNADDHTFTKTAGYNYVYQTERTNTVRVIDIRLLDIYNETIGLTKVDSVATCDATEGSWYTDGQNVYIHMYGNAIPDNSNVVLLLGGGAPIYVECATKNINLYLEGIQIYGGTTGNIYFSNSATYTQPNFYAKDCVFRYARGNITNGNAVNIIGAKYVFLQNCEASWAQKDGFNYHINNGVVPYVIEVNCIGRGNGDNTISGTENTNNGSTMHDGGKIIRINCTYYENMGANVADVGVDTQALVLGCTAFNSKATTTDMYNADFATQNSNAEMWLENCVAFGSVFSLAYSTGTIMHIKNVLYETKVGGGTLLVE